MKLISLLLLTLFFTTTVYSLTPDYEYILHIEKKLQEDQGYDCTYTIDNESKDFTRKSSQSKTLDDDIQDTLQIDCSTKLDKLTLQILKDNVKVFSESKKGISSYSYKLDYNLVNLRLESDNTLCTLNTNGVKEDIKVYGRIKVEQSYMDKFSLSCNSSLDSLEVITKDRNGKELYYNLHTDISKLSYEDSKYVSQELLISLYLHDWFDVKTKCTMYGDDKKYSYTFSKDSSLEDKYIEVRAGKTFKLDCGNKIDKITLSIDNVRLNREMYETTYHNKSSISINLDSLNLTLQDYIDKTIPVAVDEPVKKPEPEPIKKDKPTPVKPTVNTPQKVDTPVNNIVMNPVKEEKPPNIFVRFFNWLTFW